jgi:YfiH family protein
VSAAFLTSPILAGHHGFFTRRGGVSTGHYASLNCSTSGGDDPALVAENRRRVAVALGAAPEALLGLKQVHGAQVITVDRPWPAGEGRPADAMVSRVSGIALGIITADCAPVLFLAGAAGLAGAAHAGWRGAVAGVLEATIEAMIALGAMPARIAAAIGPCIAQPSYEVGADLRQAVLARTPAAETCFSTGVRALHWQFDLAGYCLMRLGACGIGEVAALGVDTLADEDTFFSHRRRSLAGGGPIGHQISVIRV